MMMMMMLITNNDAILHNSDQRRIWSNLLAGAKHPAFSTNHLANTDKTKPRTTKTTM